MKVEQKPRKREELPSLPKIRQSRAARSGFEVQFPLIVKTQGVCGGSARLLRTRIPVWLLENLRRQGFSEAQILSSYPSLSSIDLVQAWQYVESHRKEIEREIRENESEDSGS